MSKVNILRLQQLYFDIEDVKEYSPENLQAMIELMQRYQQIVRKLFQQSPDDFDNLFQIGLEEIIDHLTLMKGATRYREKAKCFSDLHFYFQQSVLDARAKLVCLGRKNC